MKKTLLFQVAVFIALNFATFNLLSQNKKFHLSDPNENFYQTQKRMNKHFKKFEKEIAEEKKEKAEGKAIIGKNEEVELAGYELYKRWENYMEPRVYPSGDKTLASKAYEEYQNHIGQNSQQRSGTPNSVQSATWTPVGPFGDPSGGNAGRINAVRFDPTNANGLWICTPDGGLWSSANGGTNWSTTTDQLNLIGNSDVVFDPTNAQNVYMATGDGDAGDSYSIGVLKSTNGGSTWNTTGLTWTVSSGNLIHKMLINPLNKNVLFAATSGGIYRTTNAGTTWNVVMGGDVTDIEYVPGDTTTIYGVNPDFYKSTDGGATFNIISSGLPASGSQARMAIAVTPANPAYVYIISSDNASSGFQGFYRSTDNGTTFTSMATSPNLMGWAYDGSDTGGQGWYTLSIAASPTNADEVVTGGVNIWRTLDGGTTWGIFAHWTADHAPYVHADIHDLIYKDGTTIYTGTDGGIFFTSNSGTSFAAINGNMNIAEIYKIGLSKTTYNLAITGHQDNGTNIYGGGWGQTMGGDGMDCFIDWSNDQVMYGEQYQGSLNRTTNGGAAWTAITTGLTGNGGWVTPWHQDPITPAKIYCGYQQLFKSANQGTNWTVMGSMAGTSSIREFAVAPSNPLVIYVIKGNALYKTVNGGTSWTNVTGSLPAGSASMTWVAVEDDDPNSVWVTFSGYSSGNKVYVSTNAGSTWTNYSTGLPNLPTNCITYWNGTKDGVYVGCDVGIYYRDSTMSSWIAYNAGLPNVSVHDLAIFYPLAKLRAATYGRGVWEADLYNNGTQAPIANFVADQTVICSGMTVNFTDQSTFGPTSWAWNFQSGTPATSNAQNPSVVYNTPGTYSVSMTATNTNGTNTMTKVTYITVSPVVALPLVEGFQTVTFPPTNWQNYDANSDNIKWQKNTTVGKASTACMFFDNYNQNAGGTRDEMRTPKYDFSGLNVAKLYFDVAYARYDPTYSDSLAVLVSTDCGLTWNREYYDGGTTLATAPDLTTALFVPTASQWRTDTVYLTAYLGMANVMVAFQNRGYYGQGLYIDNVNIIGAASGPPTSVFSYSNSICSGQNTPFTDQSTNIPTSWNWQFPGGTPSSSGVQNPVISYTAGGTYSVTLIASNGSGAGSTTTQTVSVTASPTVTITASTNTVCFGQSVILTAGGATNYTWTPGNSIAVTRTVTPGGNTTYTLTGNMSGCKNATSLTVVVNPLPTLTVTTSSDTVCLGNSTTINAAGTATTYSWNPAAGLSATTGSSVTANPTVTTTYSVSGTDVNGCVKTVVHKITVNACSGVNTISQSGILKIYPNPNNGVFTLDIPSGTSAYQVEIRNALGQLVYTDKIQTGNSSTKRNINLSEKAKGVYSMIIRSGDETTVTKMIVE